MYLLRHVLIRMARKRLMWIWSLAFAVALAGIVTFFRSSDQTLDIFVVDNDNSAVSLAIAEKADDWGDVRTGSEGAETALTTGSEFVVIIPEGFEKSLLSETTRKVTTAAIAGSETVFLEQSLTGYLDHVSTLAAASSDGEEFRALLAANPQRMVRLEEESFDNRVLERTSVQLYFALLSFVTLMTLSQWIPTFLLDDREQRIYGRLFASPLSSSRYIGTVLAAFAILGIVFVTALLTLSLIFYGSTVLSYLDKTLPLFLAYMVSCLALSAFIAGFSTNREKANVLQTSISMIAAITGGAFVSLAILPESLRAIGMAFPTYWFNLGIEAVYQKGEAGWTEAGTILLISAILFLFTAWRLRRHPLA